MGGRARRSNRPAVCPGCVCGSSGLLRAAGGTGWIVKPFDPEKLISVIHRVVH